MPRKLTDSWIHAKTDFGKKKKKFISLEFSMEMVLVHRLYRLSS